MWVERLTSTRTLQALELAAQFAEQRQRVLAENIANIDTPDYHSRRLDPEVFQKALTTALAEAKARGTSRLNLRGDAQVSTGPQGELIVQPVEEPAANVLFHDGTNARLEHLVTQISENALSYELAMSLLRNRYSGLLDAIRGKVT